jgi:hypothetical protein
VMALFFLLFWDRVAAAPEEIAGPRTEAERAAV